MTRLLHCVHLPCLCLVLYPKSHCSLITPDLSLVKKNHHHDMYRSLLQSIVVVFGIGLILMVKNCTCGFMAQCLDRHLFIQEIPHWADCQNEPFSFPHVKLFNLWIIPSKQTTKQYNLFTGCSCSSESSQMVHAHFNPLWKLLQTIFLEVSRR